jgi:hypothetical protein
MHSEASTDISVLQDLQGDVHIVKGFGIMWLNQSVERKANVEWKSVLTMASNRGSRTVAL